MRRFLYAFWLILAWIIIYMLTSFDDDWWSAYRLFYAQEFYQYDLITNTAKSSVNFDFINDVGYWKYGVPYIENPKFTDYKEIFSEVEDDAEIKDKVFDIYYPNMEGIYVQIDWDARFYPSNILEEHHLVNDNIWNKYILVSYSPYSWGFAVFDREVKDQVATFADSWKVHDSSMLMYDLTTETLWSHSAKMWVVWDYNEVKLWMIDWRMITLKDFNKNYPRGKVLLPPEWSNKNYEESKYTEYNESEELKFKVLNPSDDRFTNKKMFVTIKDESWESAAFDLDSLEEGYDYIVKLWENFYKAEHNGEEVITYKNYLPYPHAYEFWFSWINVNVWSENVFSQKKDED